MLGHIERAYVVSEYLQAEAIPEIDWLSYSPYLNLIGHVWNSLGRLISPQTLQKLKNALSEGWSAIPQDLLYNLVTYNEIKM